MFDSIITGIKLLLDSLFTAEESFNNAQAEEEVDPMDFYFEDTDHDFYWS